MYRDLSSLLSRYTPRHCIGLHHLNRLPPYTNCKCVLDLRKSTTSLVFMVFRRRQFLLLQSLKALTRSLYSSFCPFLIHATIAVSSEYLYIWQDSELYLISDVNKVNKNGDKAVPCGAPMLLNTFLETQFPSLTNYGRPFR